MAQPFDALVVEVDVGDCNFLWQGFGPYCKAVIMRSDLDATANQILDWLIAPAMAKDQLESLTPESASQQLMSKADAKGRRARLSDVSYFCDFFVHGSRITGSVREINAV